MSKMKFASLLTATALIAQPMTALAGYIHNDDYVVTTKSVPVKLMRGELVEYGRLEYRAWVHKREQQTGHTFKPLSGKFSDTRQCRTQISGHMTRSYHTVSLIGKEDSQGTAAISIPVAVSVNSNGLASILDHDPCSDYRGQINQAVAQSKAKVLAQFEAKMRADLQAFTTEQTGLTVVVNP